MNDKDLWDQFHTMWGDAKAQRSYVKANWLALQSMIKNRLEAHPELPTQATAMAESEKATRFDQLREPTWRLCNRVLMFSPSDADASLVHRMVQPPASAEEAKAQRERITEQANKWVYNVPGHVCPDTNRLALTVRDVIEREKQVGDLTSFVYDEEAKSMGLDPWRMIDGIDPSIDGKTADLWWASGHSAVNVPMDKIIYIQQPKKKKKSDVSGAPPPKPAIEVSAYKPKDEEHPVLLVTVGGEAAGMVFRRSDPMYWTLKEVCDGKPVWLFGQEAMPL